MTTTKHTEGPWAVYDDFYIKVDRPGYIGGSHAEVKSCDAVPPQNRDEHKANARLIAATPELLAELTSIEWGALGQSGPRCPSCGGNRDHRGHDRDCRLAAALAKATGNPC
jgi:hypothetical protein